MITISATVNVSKDGGEIKSVSITPQGNNISSSISEVLGNKNVSVGNPFILGHSKLGDGSHYTDRLPYFMSSEWSDSNGMFHNRFVLTIKGEADLEQAVIVFDKQNNRHPNTIIVDGETWYDDDPQFEIKFNSDKTTHEIIIDNWNAPNSPLIITNIYSNINVEIDDSNLISFSRDMFETSNMKYPQFGIISNSGNLTVLDKNEGIIDLITYKILHSGAEVSVQINNTNSGISNQVCVMTIKELDYDNDSRKVSMSLKDNLEEWQDINVNPIYYDPSNPKSEYAKFFYDYLYNKTVELGYEFEELDEGTKNVLNNTLIKYPLLESGSLWDSWDKLCQLCFLYIYENNLGKIVVKYNIN